MKFFSIVTINFNNLSGLQKTCESVFQQNKDLFEFIVVDGNSTDGSIAYLKSQNQIDTLIIANDKGIYDAMNKGAKVAFGKYLWFINSGDVLPSQNSLSNLLALLSEVKLTDVIYGNVEVRYKKFTKINTPSALDKIWHSLPFSHQAVICKTQHFSDETPFKLDYNVIADQVFFYDLYAKGVQFQYLDFLFASIESGGYSETKPFVVFKEKLKLLKTNSHLTPYKTISLLKSFIFRLVVHFLKKIFPNSVNQFFTQLKYAK